MTDKQCDCDTCNATDFEIVERMLDVLEGDDEED